MKNLHVLPPFDASSITNIVQEYIEAQMMFEAIDLKIFDYLENETSYEELARKTGYHERNVELLCNALTSAGYLTKSGNNFRNTDVVNFYLNRNSEFYLGDYLTFWSKEKDLSQLGSRVKEGPLQNNAASQSGKNSNDFKQMAYTSAQEMYAGRLQDFLYIVESLFGHDEPIKALDLGGGSGILSIEFAKYFEKASIDVFDQPQVVALTKELISENEVTNQVRTVGGNFIEDSIGSDYDFIIASVIFDFVGDMGKMARKIYEALKPDGVLYLTTHNVNSNYTSPNKPLVGWLNKHVEGVDILKTDDAIHQAIEGAGFVKEKVSGLSKAPYYLFRKS